MSSNSHTAEDTKACHLQKLQLQKYKEKDVGVPDALIDLCDVQSKNCSNERLAPNMETK